MWGQDSSSLIVSGEISIPVFNLYLFGRLRGLAMVQTLLLGRVEWFL